MKIFLFPGTIILKLMKFCVKRLVVSLVAAGFVIFNSSCKGPTPEAESALADSSSYIILSSEQFNSSDMKLDTMNNSMFHHHIRASGYLDVPEGKRTYVGTYFSGRADQINIITGQNVRQGEVLFTLHNPGFIDLQREYLETSAQSKNLKAAYERMKTLAGDNTASQRELLQAESDYLAVQAVLNSLSEKLKLMKMSPEQLSAANMSSVLEIKAPFSGKISKIMIQAGQWVNPEDLAVELIANGSFIARIEVFEQDFPWLKIGRPVKFTPTGNPKAVFTGKITHLGSQIDPQKRTVLITASLDENTEIQILPGMFVNADILSDVSSANSLPESSLVEIDGKFYVLSLLEKDSSKFILQKTEVQTGQTAGGYTEILNAHIFPRETKFLTKGAFQLIKEEE